MPKVSVHTVAVPLTGAIGARIDGVDVSRPVDEETSAFLREALHSYRVLVLPGQEITHEQQIAFGATWGEILPSHQFIPGMADYPQIQHNDSGRQTGSPRDTGWHTDHTFVEEVPAVTILVSRVVPLRGGDTMWADLVGAYDTLSPPLQRLVTPLVAVHDPFQQFDSFLRASTDPVARRRLLELAPVRHPLVRVDPITGRKSLLINPSCISSIEGLHPDESRELLGWLSRHVLAPERTFRWRWTPGDVVIWSNPEVLHRVVDDYGSQRRVTQRVMVRGPRLVGPTGLISARVDAA
jgi:taurine dioxygenase